VPGVLLVGHDDRRAITGVGERPRAILRRSYARVVLDPPSELARDRAPDGRVRKEVQTVGGRLRQ
jgi:hypothetical protein